MKFGTMGTLDEAWALEPFADGYAVLGVWCGMLGWFYVTREALVKAGMFRAVQGGE